MGIRSRKQSLLSVPHYLEPLERREMFSFGVTTVGSSLVVDTGAQVVFTISKTNGDMTSIKYNGNELTAPYSVTGRYSHYESGLSSTNTTVTSTVNSSQGWIEIACKDTSLGVTQYYIARKGYNNVYMATYAAALPTPGEMRYIVYLDRTKFTPNPVSDIHGRTAIEGSDVYKDTSTGYTYSKFYSGKPFINDPSHGDVGSGVGVYMMTPNRETSSGGPFFQDIDEQGASGIELYDYMYSGHTQTEAFRPGLQGPYALAITGGGTPGTIDYSFLDNVPMTGYVKTTARGTLVGKAIGAPTGETLTIGLANSTAQYWGTANASTDNYSIGGIKPGTYTETLYYGELAVGTQSVTITAGVKTSANIHDTQTAPTSIFTIGTWDGTPTGFENASKLPTEHPSDSRMSAWNNATYTVGSSSLSTFPAAQWKDVNNSTKIVFTLSSAQVATPLTFRIGITISQYGARPQITVNSGQSYAWTSALPPAPSNQPDSRGLTRGTFRGMNTTYTYSIPASALRTGTNSITISVNSGQTGTGFLSPGIGYDAVDLVTTASMPASSATTTVKAAAVRPRRAGALLTKASSDRHEPRMHRTH